MTTTQPIDRPSSAPARRGPTVVGLVALLGFLGVSAVPSGLTMVIGGTDVFPAEWLDTFPLIDSLVAPGLTLLLGFGVGSLVAAYGVARRPSWPGLDLVTRLTGRHWAWAASLAIGVGQVVWIALEYAYLGAGSFLQPLYGTVGIGLVVLSLTPGVRAWLRA